MTPKLTEAIKKVMLKARKLLTKKVSSQLEGIYGFLPNGELKPAENYPALREIPYAAETRRQIEEFVENEKLGFSPAKARKKLVRKGGVSAWLNRFWPSKNISHVSFFLLKNPSFLNNPAKMKAGFKTAGVKFISLGF